MPIANMQLLNARFLHLLRQSVLKRVLITVEGVWSEACGLARRRSVSRPLELHVVPPFHHAPEHDSLVVSLSHASVATDKVCICRVQLFMHVNVGRAGCLKHLTPDIMHTCA